jgi:DNA-binding NtrC family response regulator
MDNQNLQEKTGKFKNLADRVKEANILLVDDEQTVLETLSGLFSLKGYNVDTAQDGGEALRKINKKEFDLLVTDIKMPMLSGLDLLKEVKRKKLDTKVVMITGYGQIPEAVSAMKAGAYDYFTKPLNDAKLLSTIERALKESLLNGTEFLNLSPLPEIVTQDPAMRKILKLVEAVADKVATILINGESGTGKSLLARYAHEKSSRRNRPFVQITCGAMPETLLESELFGHTKGSFTGAVDEKMGLFEIADGGVVFLDEISSASPSLQVKLLGVLENQTFNKIGRPTPKKIDIKVIVATNTPLEDLVVANAFRKDLYFRVNTLPITIPPLRNRPGDIELLCKHFIKKFNALSKKGVLGITEALKRKMLTYPWPGNVRELQNVVQRGLIFTEGKHMDLKDVKFLFDEEDRKQDHPEDALKSSMQLQEKEVLKATLKRFEGNKTRTATFLGLNRSTLYKKLKLYSMG